MLKNVIPEKYFHYTFEIGIFIKAFDGAVQILAGLLMLYLGPEKLKYLVLAVTSGQKNAAANYLVNAVEEISRGSLLFASLFLLSHGLVKVLLVINLWRNKLWAYPTAIAVFTLFTVYQAYLFLNNHSIGVVILTLLDIFVILLTWHEYNWAKTRRRSA